MYAIESKVSKDSDYYFYMPSKLGKSLFLYPVVVGHYTYKAGYSMHRSNLENYQLLYIEKGVCKVIIEDKTFIAKAGNFILVDCRLNHGYESYDDKGFSSLWLHFAGKPAKDFFSVLKEKYGFVFNLKTEQTNIILKELEFIYKRFKNKQYLSEACLNISINTLLTNLVTTGAYTKEGNDGAVIIDCVTDIFSPGGIQRAANYISEHYSEALQLSSLAKIADMSLYHFTRKFTQEIGMSPHQYLIAIRLAAAKFLLSTTRFSIKEISFQTGFNDVNAFCVCFRQHEKESATTYRKKNLKLN